MFERATCLIPCFICVADIFLEIWSSIIDFYFFIFAWVSRRALLSRFCLRAVMRRDLPILIVAYLTCSWRQDSCRWCHPTRILLTFGLNHGRRFDFQLNLFSRRIIIRVFPIVKGNSCLPHVGIRDLDPVKLVFASIIILGSGHSSVGGYSQPLIERGMVIDRYLLCFDIGWASVFVSLFVDYFRQLPIPLDQVAVSVVERIFMETYFSERITSLISRVFGCFLGVGKTTGACLTHRGCLCTNQCLLLHIDISVLV